MADFAAGVQPIQWTKFGRNPYTVVSPVTLSFRRLGTHASRHRAHYVKRDVIHKIASRGPNVHSHSQRAQNSVKCGRRDSEIMRWSGKIRQTD